MTSAARLLASFCCSPHSRWDRVHRHASSQDEASGGAAAAASPDATVEVVEMVGPFATKLDATIAEPPGDAQTHRHGVPQEVWH